MTRFSNNIWCDVCVVRHTFGEITRASTYLPSTYLPSTLSLLLHKVARLTRTLVLGVGVVILLRGQRTEPAHVPPLVAASKDVSHIECSVYVSVLSYNIRFIF